MEAEDNNKRIADTQTFNDYREPECHSSEDYNISNVLNRPIFMAHRRRMRKSHAKPKLKFKKVPRCDNPSSPFRVRDSHNEKYVSFYLRTYFKQNKMAKIQEEVYHSKHSENPFKEKAYKEKAASLKTIVQRLKQMCLAKPEVLQNKLPEEITKLFSNIEI